MTASYFASPCPELPQPTPSPCTSPAALFLSAFGSPPQSRFITPDSKSSANNFEEDDVLNGYTLGKQIGQGAFSVIRLATCPSNPSVVAIKLVNAPTKPKARGKLDRERRIWSSLCHEHILPLFTSFPIAGKTCFVTMYCPAGSLLDLLKSHNAGLPAPVLQPVFTQLVKALVYLHTEARIVHRDLKLENVLVDEGGGVRVADFGLARGLDNDDEDDEDGDDEASEDDSENEDPGPLHRTLSLSTASAATSGITITRKQSLNISLSSHPSLIRPGRHRHSTTSHTPSKKPKKRHGQPGSLPYAAPELVSSEQSTMKIASSPAQDIWALGIILHALLTGKLPWNDAFEPRLVWRIVCGPYTLPIGISPHASRILLGCLERDITQRWDISMVDEVAWGVTLLNPHESSFGDDINPLIPSPSSPIESSSSPFSPSSPSSRRGETSVSIPRRHRSRDTPYSKSRSTPRSRSRCDSYPYSEYSESRSPPPGLSFSVQTVLSTTSSSSNDVVEFEEDHHHHHHPTIQFPRRRAQLVEEPPEAEGAIPIVRGRLPTRRREGLPISSIGFPLSLGDLSRERDEGVKSVEGLPPLDDHHSLSLSPVRLSAISSVSEEDDDDDIDAPLVVPNPPLLLLHRN